MKIPGALVALSLAVCVAGSARADLLTFGYGNARLGADPAPGGIGVASARRLQVVWRANVGGAVSGQPLSVDGVRIGGRVLDLVVTATESGEVVALDAVTGRTVWRREVEHHKIVPDCEASPDGEFGVTGTLVADRHAGRVYAVDVDGQAWALSLRTGRVVDGWPVRVHPKGGNFVWSALTLSHGWLYVPVASLCDSGLYHGGVTAIRLNHPTDVRRWLTTGGTEAYAGGVWGWGGVSIDPRSGDVFAATGNSIGTSREDDGYAESVVRLSPTLVLEQSDHPLMPPFAVGDRDFGTTPVLVQVNGCAPQLVAINKDGELFLYDRDRIDAGPVQRLAVANQSPNLIPLYGVPAFDPATQTLVVVSPSTSPTTKLRAGVQAFRLQADCRLHLLWEQQFDPPSAGSAPTIANGVVYIGTGRNGRLRVYRLSDGAPLWARRLSTKAVFAAPTIDRATVFVADWSGHVSALRAHR